MIISVRSKFSRDYESGLKRVPPRVMGGADWVGADTKGANLVPFSGPPPVSSAQFKAGTLARTAYLKFIRMEPLGFNTEQNPNN